MMHSQNSMCGLGGEAVNRCSEPQGAYQRLISYASVPACPVVACCPWLPPVPFSSGLLAFCNPASALASSKESPSPRTLPWVVCQLPSPPLSPGILGTAHVFKSDPMTPSPVNLTHTVPMHVVVLAHGIIGRPSDLNRVRDALLKFSDEQLVVLQPDVNDDDSQPLQAWLRFFRHPTYDGVMNGAKRLADYVKQELPQYAPCKLSFIGHSLGMWAVGCPCTSCGANLVLLGVPGRARNVFSTLC